MSPSLASGTAPPRAAQSTPLGRLEHLCDPGSLRLIRTGVAPSRRHDSHEPGTATGGGLACGDGVVTGAGRVGGRPVFCYAQDPSHIGGSLGEAHAESVVRLLDMARQRPAPVVGFMESGGARLQEGTRALAGYGRIFRRSVQLSRVVPQISVVCGTSAGGGAYSPALTDFVILTGGGRMFLTGPRVVHAALGETVTMDDLGGAAVHGRNGVAHFSVNEEGDAVRLVRELLDLLPHRVGTPAPVAASVTPAGDPAAPVPAQSRKVYDVRDVAAAIFDGGRLLEVWPTWARNMVTSLCRLDGRTVGLVANQPRSLAGVIDARAAEKAALFVKRCARFGLPLVVLVDTPGFMPGRREEAAGVIRYGADLLHAFAAAAVPKVTVVLRKAYGGAAITMNSRDLGADLAVAWPGAEIGIMAAGQAVDIVHRRGIERDGSDRDGLCDLYRQRHLSAEAAAASGFIDEVIEPAQTRDRIAWALGWTGEGR